MSNKKTVLAAGVALAIVAYGGATWYMGQKAEASYQEAVTRLGKLIGEKTILTNEYRKGFFSADARLVLEWKQPQVEQEHDGDETAEPPKPMHLVVNSHVRHGPMAGGRFAAAATVSNFAIEGMDEKSRQVLAKATAPTLTTVHHLGGSHSLRFVLPQGELGDEEMTMSWQELIMESKLSDNNQHAKGDLRWPGLSISALTKNTDEDEDEDDEADPEDLEEGQAAEALAATRSLGERTLISFEGLDGSFETRMLEGLWGMGPGKGSMNLARLLVSNTPAGGGETKTVADLKDFKGNSVVEADKATLGMVNVIKAKGRIGELDFDSLELEEKLQRLDMEALRNFQRYIIDAYYAKNTDQAMPAPEERGPELLMENAPRLIAAKPAYSMKLSATYLGKTGMLEYGAEVQNPPEAEQIQQMGFMPVLVQSGVLHANASLPKSWIGPIMKSTGQDEVAPEEIEAMLGMAEASGYAKLEGENLTSSFRMQGGKMELNGKQMPLPFGALNQ
ncbi:YdgA family protein [Comamonas composti]|uniref:YdgA family protein n=1 Tax=Comamonas composti TaxID=408558 RepID=UPI00040ABC38|nr:YdgA family protein [Comamonas composti]